MTNTMTIAQTAANDTRHEATMAEICIGTIMAVGTIAGIWGVVSLMIRYLA